jgi:hypothetical protein
MPPTLTLAVLSPFASCGHTDRTPAGRMPEVGHWVRYGCDTCGRPIGWRNTAGRMAPGWEAYELLREREGE